MPPSIGLLLDFSVQTAKISLKGNNSQPRLNHLRQVRHKGFSSVNVSGRSPSNHTHH